MFVWSLDVFNKFKDDSGNFKKFLGKDVKGMLSLYEASYLAFEGENLLDETLAFTRMHLKDLKRDVSKSIAEQISHALEVPLHHRMLRLEARWYIEAYSKGEDANGVLLELALCNQYIKLSFKKCRGKIILNVFICDQLGGLLLNNVTKKKKIAC